MHTYFISFFGWRCLCTRILKWKFSKVSYNKVTTSLFEAFKQKEIFQCNFDYKHLFIKTISGKYVSVRIGQYRLNIG